MSVDRAVGFVEEQRTMEPGTRFSILGRGTWEVRRIKRALSERGIASRLHELTELFVRHLAAIHPEAASLRADPIRPLPALQSRTSDGL
jgi:hypothetical protein